MATQSQVRAAKTWTIELNIVNSTVVAHGEWQNRMAVGDTARFVRSQADHIVIEFRSLPAQDREGHLIPADLLPFGTDEIVDPDPSKLYRVTNSCKAMMSFTIVDENGFRFDHPEDERGRMLCTIVCTGGGDHPVSCP